MKIAVIVFRVLLPLMWALLLTMQIKAAIVNCEGSGFLKETNDHYVFKNELSILIIDKHTWKIRFLDNEGIERYADYNAPAFFISNKWINVNGSSEVEKIDEKEVIISITGNEGIDFSIIVKSINDLSFNCA